MLVGTRKTRVLILSTLMLGAISALLITAEGGRSLNPFLQLRHPAVGSWFGKAVQLTDGSPGIVLTMSPTLTGTGSFLGNDFLALAGPPFGPHTTAHGRWDPTGRTSITAAYSGETGHPIRGK